MQLKITENRHEPTPYWLQPLPDAYVDQIIFQGVELFDQNGYDMCRVEQVYAEWNGYKPKEHREKYTNKEVWMVDIEDSREGPHINHCDIYQRRGFGGDALLQLEDIALKHPIFNKLTKMTPKWGVDISIDYVNRQGECFELLHFEWDDFNLPTVLEKKTIIEEKFAPFDPQQWNICANEMLTRQKEWKNLPFFEQSDWKQRFWGLPKEQFKEVIWSDR